MKKPDATTAALIAEFGARDLLLSEVVRKYFDMTMKAAANSIALGTFPLPTYRAGGKKSPLLVRAEDLAQLLDQRYLEGTARFEARPDLHAA